MPETECIMHAQAVFLLVAIAHIKMSSAVSRIAPTAPMTTAKIGALHAFSQMWSAMWGVSQPLDYEADSKRQSCSDAALGCEEDKHVR